MKPTPRDIPGNLKHLAITLQRLKTSMEVERIQDRYWSCYWKLSETIWELEAATGIRAAALRDAEDYAT